MTTPHLEPGAILASPAWAGTTWGCTPRTFRVEPYDHVWVHRDGRVVLETAGSPGDWTRVSVRGPIVSLWHGSSIVGVARSPERVVSVEGMTTLAELIYLCGGDIPAAGELDAATKIAEEALG